MTRELTKEEQTEWAWDVDQITALLDESLIKYRVKCIDPKDNVLTDVYRFKTSIIGNTCEEILAKIPALAEELKYYDVIEYHGETPYLMTDPFKCIHRVDNMEFLIIKQFSINKDINYYNVVFNGRSRKSQ